MRTIQRAERDVQDAVDRVLKCAESKGAPTFASVEGELWTALLGLGRAVVALFLTRYAARPRSATYVHDDVRFAFDPETRRRTEIGTRFGKVVFARGIGRPIGGRQVADIVRICPSIATSGCARGSAWGRSQRSCSCAR
jgi:hypothetical protein